jgi:TatD DNase family protein
MFDAHAHLQDPRFREVHESWLEAATHANITGICSCGTSPGDWEATRTLAHHPFPFRLVTGFGVHPWYVRDLPADWQERLEAIIVQEPTAVIGEIGLDGLRDTTSWELQESILRWQLDLAIKHNRPVVLHGARAWGRLVDVLKSYANQLPGFMAHSFGGSLETLKELSRLGGYLSFSGTLCNVNATKVRLAAQAVPEDRLLVETDSPDLFPLGGKTLPTDKADKPVNHPGNLSLVCNTLAALRNLAPEIVAEITTDNAKRLFK